VLRVGAKHGQLMIYMCILMGGSPETHVSVSDTDTCSKHTSMSTHIWVAT
jgi:hypothetical protein